MALVSGFEAFQLTFVFVVLAFYHCAEYFIHRHFHPDSTDYSSFLITPQYLIAYGFGLVEFVIECLFLDFKNNYSNPVVWIGCIMVFVGLYIRFAAIITAGKSFTHRIAYRKEKEHKLITNGIYKYIRHPGYLGFFIFAIGTQLFFVNFLSPFAFAAVLWRFFNDRIKDEEATLIEFFGNDYAEYRKKTPTYIPFIK